MLKLALTAAHNKFETPASLVARIAYRNCVTPQEFCSDLGMKWAHICLARPEQLKKLCHLSGADIDQLILAGPRCDVGGRRIVGLTSATRSAIKTTVTRICPVCSLTEFEKFGKYGPYQRLDWQVKAISVCHFHHTPLVELPSAGATQDPYDVVRQIGDHFGQIKDAVSDGVHSVPTAFEKYLYNRIWLGPCGSWLGGLDLSLLADGCLALGKILRPDMIADRREAREVGYDALRRGPSGLLEALTEVRSRHVHSPRPYASELGSFLTWLTRTQTDAHTADIRGRVRNFIDHNYAVVAGADLLGKRITHPRMVSLNAVSRKYGIGKRRSRGALVAEEILSPSHAAKTTIVTPTQVDMIVSFWEKFLEQREASKVLNLHVDHIRKLEKCGVLTSGELGTKRRYIEKRSVENLLERMSQLEIGTRSASLQPLKYYCNDNGVPLAKVIGDWFHGGFDRLHRDPMISGLSGLLVTVETDQNCSGMELRDDLPIKDAAKYLRTNLRQIRKLRDGGFIAQIKKSSAKSNRQRVYITQASIRDFEERYVTLGQLSHLLDIAPIQLAANIDRLNIDSVICAAGYVRVYPLKILDQLAIYQIRIVQK